MSLYLAGTAVLVLACGGGASGPSSETALDWRSDGQRIVLEPTAEKVYLVVPRQAGAQDLAQRDSGLTWSSDPRLSVDDAVDVYELTLKLRCGDDGPKCNPCLKADDCPPVAPPVRGVEASIAGRLTLWAPPAQR